MLKKRSNQLLAFFFREFKHLAQMFFLPFLPSNSKTKVMQLEQKKEVNILLAFFFHSF